MDNKNALSHTIFNTNPNPNPNTNTNSTGLHDAEAPAPRASPILNIRHQAYLAIKSELDSLDNRHVTAYNLDPIYAAGVVSNTVVRLRPFRETLGKLIQFDMRHLDRIELYAFAVLYLHTKILSFSAQAEDYSKRIEEATHTRAIFLAYAEVLVKTGLFDGRVIEKIREGSGHTDLVEDTFVLIDLYQMHPETTREGAPLTPKALERASVLIESIHRDLLATDESQESLQALMAERQRAAFLLSRSNAQLRGAMDYLRLEQGDSATWVPSIYAPKRGGSSKSSDKNVAPPAASPSTPRPEPEHAPSTPSPAVPRDPQDNPFDDNG